MRTAASHEFERTEPFQVNVRTWPWPTPLLTLKRFAEDDCEKGISMLPLPFVVLPGSPRLKLPELSATLELPVMPLVSAEPSQPEVSFLVLMSPTRVVEMSSR